MRIRRLALTVLAALLAISSAYFADAAGLCARRSICITLLGGKGGGTGSCSNKLDLTQTCNDVLFFTIGR